MCIFYWWKANSFSSSWEINLSNDMGLCTLNISWVSCLFSYLNLWLESNNRFLVLLFYGKWGPTQCISMFCKAGLFLSNIGWKGGGSPTYGFAIKVELSVIHVPRPTFKGLLIKIKIKPLSYILLILTNINVVTSIFSRVFWIFTF